MSHRYLLLIRPAANRVFGRSAPALVEGELTVLGALALGGALGEIGPLVIAGVPYVAFTTTEPLGDEALAVLAHLSGAFALFERGGEGDHIRPVALPCVERWDDDLVTIQRYPGKTNEQFTRLLLNLTLAVARGGAAFCGNRLRVLDPLCGRGTTLNQALLLGHHATGIEIDKADVEAYDTFLSTWLQDNRLRHLIERVPLRIERKVVGKRIDARFAATKEQLREGDVQRVRVVADDTVRTLEHVARGSCDAIVADLPYGVRHGSKTSGAGLRRGPAELLDDALAVWRDALAPGGAIGLSWNTMVLPRDGVVCRLEGAGFTVLAGGAWDGFAHRVDQAIVRDLVVARPTAEPASGREAGLRPSQPERA